jgi:mono/diheme cytochrome c family protein
MRQLIVFAAIGGLTGAGCDSAPPPEIVFHPASVAQEGKAYPGRSDWLVVQPPAAVPPAWNTSGYPPVRSLELGSGKTPDENQIKTLKPELGKNILNPADPDSLPKSDRAAVAQAVDALFGTPLVPVVPAGKAGKNAAAIEKLHLDTATLAHGAGLYRQWCVSCHGPAGGGDGPAASTLSPAPRDYRTGLFKFVSSTPTLAGKPRRADLEKTLRRGLDGTAMPAFPRFSQSELDAIVSYVIHLSLRGEAEFTAIKRLIIAFEDADPPAQEVAQAVEKALQQWLDADTTPMIPPPAAATSAEQPALTAVPADPATTPEARLESAARGYRLFVEKTGAGCASCHVDFGRAQQLKYDAWANVIQPRNLLLGMYRAGRSSDELYSRIYIGIAGTGMPSHRQLVEPPATDGTNKIWDLVHFVQAAADPAQRAALRAKYGVKWE